MMHKSKLAGFIIDCQAERPDDAAEFWGAALGMEVQIFPGEEGARYSRLLDPHSQLHIEVQAVDHPSRVHLDIETDNIDAEVARLVRAGAQVVKRMPKWVVLQAPTGQRFCVVSVCSAGFSETANEWD